MSKVFHKDSVLEDPLPYSSALELLMGLADFERSKHSPGHSSFHLERINLLMRHLDEVHHRIPTIHIAGTKGKGSTCAMVTSILSEHGKKVGFFSSPHLHSAVERIRIGSEPISQEDFAGLVREIWPIVEDVSLRGGYGGVTTFEAMTCMGFRHFYNVNADFQVIEVGMGGRLDATNIVSPKITAITSISLDHVGTLGDTIGKIAVEKAGIIKRGIPVVLAPQPAEAREVIYRIANNLESPVIDVEENYSWKDLKSGRQDTVVSSQEFVLASPQGEYNLKVPLAGDYQLENAATAIAVAEALSAMDDDFTFNTNIVGTGLGKVQWKARMEVLGDKNDTSLRIVVDGAHNPYSLERMLRSLGSEFHYDRVVVIFGGLSGHNIYEMVGSFNQMKEDLAGIIVAPSRHPKSASGNELAKMVLDHKFNLIGVSQNVSSALREAKRLVGPNDIILGTGSLSVAAEIREDILGIAPEIYSNFDAVKTFN